MPATGKEETHPGGDPVGFIIELENGFRIWHMGDSGVFGDMKWIGGHFTMDPADAAYALRELIKPKAAMPMHYGANPLAKGTAAEFLKAMNGSATKVIVPKPGEAVRF